MSHLCCTAALLKPLTSVSRPCLQVTPCARPAQGDDPTFSVTGDVQSQGVSEIATVVDVSIRAIAGGEDSAQVYMMDVLPTLPRVDDAVINTECFG